MVIEPKGHSPADLSTCINLKRLVIRDTPNPPLAAISTLRYLRQLDIGGRTHITREFLSTLHIDRLSFDDTPPLILSTGLTSASTSREDVSLPSIRHLSLRRYDHPIGDLLRLMPNLLSLTCQECPASQAHTHRRNPFLRYLTDPTQLDRPAPPSPRPRKQFSDPLPLAICPRLECLSLSDCSEVLDEDFEGTEGLTDIVLSTNHSLTSKAIKGRCQLVSLDISYCDFDDDLFDGLNSLSSLDVRYCLNLSDERLASLPDLDHFSVYPIDSMPLVRARIGRHR